MIVNKKERSADMEIGMCDWVLERLNEYIDGELNNSDAEIVRAHIDICPNCKKAYEELLAVESLFDESEEEMPEGFVDSVMARVAQEERKPKKSPFVLFRNIGGIAIAAVVMLTVVASPLIGGVIEDSVNGEGADIFYAADADLEKADDVSGKAPAVNYDDAEYDYSEIADASQDEKLEVLEDFIIDTESVPEVPEFKISFGKNYAVNMLDGTVAYVNFKDEEKAIFEKDGKIEKYDSVFFEDETVLIGDGLKFDIIYGETVYFNQTNG